MPHAVETVERHRQRQRKLGQNLRRHRPGRKGRSHALALQMPAEQWRDEVGGTEDVEAAGEDGAGNAVERGENPGYLWAVDGQMRGGGAVLALLDEDFVRVGGCELLSWSAGCCWAGAKIVSCG